MLSGNEENMRPAHPAWPAHVNQLRPVYLKTCWGARYVQQLWYLHSRDVDSGPFPITDTRKLHQKTETKHTQTYRTTRRPRWGAAHENKLPQICCLLCSQRFLFLRLCVLHIRHHTTPWFVSKRNRHRLWPSSTAVTFFFSSFFTTCVSALYYLLSASIVCADFRRKGWGLCSQGHKVVLYTAVYVQAVEWKFAM